MAEGPGASLDPSQHSNDQEDQIPLLKLLAIYQLPFVAKLATSNVSSNDHVMTEDTYQLLCLLEVPKVTLHMTSEGNMPPLAISIPKKYPVPFQVRIMIKTRNNRYLSN